MKTKETQFGFKKIAKSEKVKRVREVFDSVSNNYDLMNNLMSFGLHKMWKKIVIETSSLPKQAKILDVAAGTADITLAFAQLDKDFQIFQTDINYSMLIEGQKKLINHIKS